MRLRGQAPPVGEVSGHEPGVGRWLRRGVRPTENAAAVAVFLILLAIPFFQTGYTIYIVPQYVLFGVLAMSLGLLWGFAGILSFGQAAFFTIGAYAMGITLKNLAPGVGAAGGFALAALIGFAVAGLVGYFLFSGGVRGSYFVLVTLAISVITERVAISQSQITGGFNGMFIDRMALPIPVLDGRPLSDVGMYFLVWAFALVLYVALRILVRAKFGRVLVGIRENEERTESLGFQSNLYKTLAFGLSGAVAAAAGALYGTHAQFVAPSLAGVLFSTEVVVWVALGGRSSLLGALLGGVLLASLSNYLSAFIPEYWQLALGLLFILVIGFLRGGVADVLERVGRAK